MQEFKLVTDYWVEFILLVIVVGHLLCKLIPIVVDAIIKLDHHEKKKSK